MARAAHVQTIGELFTGESEVAASASGFLIGDDLLITNDHAVPDFGGKYQSTRIDVRLGSRMNSPRAGIVIARDPVRDLALVKITPAVSPRPYCPVAALAAASLVPIGSRLYALGYPLDQDLSIIDGLVSNHSMLAKWQTNAAFTTGDSGGPVFSARGYVIGIAVGGITEFTNLDGVRSPVFGVNYLIPIAAIAGCPLEPEITLHANEGCLPSDNYDERKSVD